MNFESFTREDVFAIASWRYEAPYNLYNLSTDTLEEDIKIFLDPASGYHAIRNPEGDLLAYCCFGGDAQVPGGDYSLSALDIGLGLRPDLTGQGSGILFVREVISFARRAYPDEVHRVTIANFNKRAQRVWEKAGFSLQQNFARASDGLEFVMMIKDYSN